MSEPTKEQLSAESEEMFVNDFWDSISTKLKWEILCNKFGNEMIQADYLTWMENKHEN